MVLIRLQSSKGKDMIGRMLECALALIYCDASLTLRLLHSTVGEPGINAFFDLLFKQVPSLVRDCTQRLIVLSFTALLSLPANELPPCVAANSAAMFQTIIAEVVSIEETAARESEEGGDNDEEDDDEDNDDDFGVEDEDDEEGDDDDEDDDEDGQQGNVVSSSAAAVALEGLAVPEGGYDENEDCVNAEDEQYRKHLEKVAASEGQNGVSRRVYRNGELVEGEEDEDDDEDYDDDDDENYAVTLPTDAMDISEFFVASMTQLAARDGGLVSRLQASLTPVQSERMMQVIQAVETKKASAAASSQAAT